MQDYSQFLELIKPQPGFKVLDITAHADALSEAVQKHLLPFPSHRLALALYPGEHISLTASDSLKIEEISSYNTPFRALPRDNDIVIIRDVFHKHTQAERILKSIYTTLANTGDVIIITKSEDADVQGQIDTLERLEFRSPNSIDILDGYTLVMAKKMHMWGNGL